MFGKHSAGNQYKDIFDKLSYSNKVLLNEISDNVDRKKLNRIAKQNIATSIAASFLDYQNRNEPLENLLGPDISVFCNKMCENATKASVFEKLLAFIRNAAACSLILSAILLAVSLYKGNGFIIEGIAALQMSGGVLVSALCFPLFSYRDAMHMPGNIIFRRNAISTNGLLSMLGYALLCIVCVVIYKVVFWNFPTVLMVNGFGHFKLNIMAWVIVSAIVFTIFYVLESYTVKQNCDKANYTT